MKPRGTASLYIKALTDMQVSQTILMAQFLTLTHLIYFHNIKGKHRRETWLLTADMFGLLHFEH